MKKKRVLIIDGELSIADAMESILADGGYEAVKSLTGLGALAAAAKTTFDLAIVDLRLPDMGGLDVLNKILQLNPNMIAILTSSYEIAPGWTTESAIRGVLVKPFSPADLMETASAVLALRDRPVP
ncbi:MAG TPA: response regulator [Blastocatellia bacterium]